jgi:hypothetical protein
MSEQLNIEEEWSLKVQIEDMSEGEGKRYRCFLYDSDTYNKEWGKGWNESLSEGWGNSPRAAFINATQKIEWKEKANK